MLREENEALRAENRRLCEERAPQRGTSAVVPRATADASGTAVPSQHADSHHGDRPPMPTETPERATEIMETLLELDAPVLEALEQAHIRLLRSTWLIAQPDGYRIEHRQALEAREAQGESPLLTGAEATALVKTARRGAGVLTYGVATNQAGLLPPPRRRRPCSCAQAG